MPATAADLQIVHDSHRRPRADYQRQYEPIWFGRRERGPHLLDDVNIAQNRAASSAASSAWCCKIRSSSPEPSARTSPMGGRTLEDIVAAAPEA
jgi:hypothetical protein